MIGRTNGGGMGLNFKVLGGTAEPAEPKEDTIWINTETDITGWEFSATEPTATDGMVWITTGTASSVAFNALKKNSVMVYPLAVKQYVGGAWARKSAQSFQNGAWHPWVISIVENGVIAEEYGFGTDVINSSNYASTITQYDGYFQLQSKDEYSALRCTDNKVDLTNVSRIELDADVLTTNTHSTNSLFSGASLVVLTSNNSGGNTTTSASALFAAQAQTKTKGRQTLVIDNSDGGLKGEYYIGIVTCSYSSSGKGKINVYNLKCM